MVLATVDKGILLKPSFLESQKASWIQRVNM